MPMRETWTRIEAWLQAHVPTGANVLSPARLRKKSPPPNASWACRFPRTFRLRSGCMTGSAADPG